MIDGRALRKAVVILAGLWLAGMSLAAQEPERIWSDFVAKLKAGTIGAADLKPEYTSVEQQLDWLRQLKAEVDKERSWAELENGAEARSVGGRVQVVVRFRMGGEAQTMSFTFRPEGSRWLYSHMEMILLRLDQVGPPPVSVFPDIPETTKAWIREETYWSTLIGSFYLPLARSEGAESARRRFLDGPGYLVSAKTWVPLLTPPRAFVLFLCWEQSVLRGSKVVLERLDDSDAVVRMEPLYFALYKSSAHLKTWISFADYRALFEAVWTDRAHAAGWTVAFEYEDPEGLACRLRLSRKAETRE